MPLVFIHGVNVREGKAYDKELMLRNQYFCNIFYKLLGREITAENILSPYWGDLATNITTGSPFLPGRKGAAANASQTIKTSGPHTHNDDDGDEHGHDDHAAEHLEEASLLDLARNGSIEQVLDVVIATASEQAEATAEQANELSKLAFRAIELNRQFKSADEEMHWLGDLKNDAELLQKLETALQQNGAEQGKQGSSLRHFRSASEWLKENYGSVGAAKRRLSLKKQQVDSGIKQIVNSAKTHIKQVREARRNATSHIAAAAFTGPVRRLFHERLFLFIGDSFLYFGQRGTPQVPGAIVQRVVEALEKAEAQKQNSGADDKLIVVAHSMGGNIMADIVSHFRPDREIDILITVASQFPLFADLHMFPGLDTRSRPIAKPANVKRWINFYDVNDVLGFTAHPMFADIEDVDFASGRLGLATHADCFKFVSLYERMAETVRNSRIPSKA